MPATQRALLNRFASASLSAKFQASLYLRSLRGLKVVVRGGGMHHTGAIVDSMQHQCHGGIGHVPSWLTYFSGCFRFVWHAHFLQQVRLRKLQIRVPQQRLLCSSQQALQRKIAMLVDDSVRKNAAG